MVLPHAVADANQGQHQQSCLRCSDIIVLGVKPVYMRGILAALAPHLEPRHLVVSIAAGLKLDGLEAALPDGTRVVRVMPNTPCLIGAAASTYVMGSHANEDDKEKVDALMSSVGEFVCPASRVQQGCGAMAMGLTCVQGGCRPHTRRDSLLNPLLAHHLQAWRCASRSGRWTAPQRSRARGLRTSIRCINAALLCCAMHLHYGQQRQADYLHPCSSAWLPSHACRCWRPWQMALSTRASPATRRRRWPPRPSSEQLAW